MVGVILKKLLIEMCPCVGRIKINSHVVGYLMVSHSHLILLSHRFGRSIGKVIWYRCLSWNSQRNQRSETYQYWGNQSPRSKWG